MRPAARFCGRSGGIALLAFGAATLSLTVVAIIAREDAAERYNAPENQCPPPTETLNEQCRGLAGSESAWGATRWISLPIGVVFAAAGAALLLFTRPAPV